MMLSSRYLISLSLSAASARLRSVMSSTTIMLRPGFSPGFQSGDIVRFTQTLPPSLRR
ncbi:MAG: hypothetical protein ACD_87C00243G0001 [uncultured bacterium]|nr:MAG: hypothetical protein ACD_87C00243G0001 [uncultured bacterium]